MTQEEGVLLEKLERAREVHSREMQEAMDAPNSAEFLILANKAGEKLANAASRYKLVQTVYKLTPIDPEDDKDIYTLQEFVDCCMDGGFIDYDGSGNYATETEESNISIWPSEVTADNYRKDFTHIVWYNR